MSVLDPLRPPEASHPARPAGSRHRGWRRLRDRPSAVFGLAVLAAFVLVAVFADHVVHLGAPPSPGSPALAPPSAEHWFGTDSLGRDVFAQVVRGTRATLVIGFLSAAIAAAVGVLVGGVSGLAGGLVDDVLMRLVEIVEIVPRFFLAVVLAALFGPSQTVILLLLGLTFWPETARLLRAEVLSIRRRDYVVAQRCLGVPETVIFLRHILPNAGPVVIVAATLHVGSAVLVQAGLAFLGLVDTATISWGAMVQAAQPFLAIAWWPSVFPGVAISLLVIAANLLADGLLAVFAVRGAQGGTL